MPNPRRSDHFDGTRFHNTDPTAKDRPLSDVWQWYRQRSPSVWPRDIVDETGPLPDTPEEGVISVTFIGHSTFLIRMRGMNLLTDPVFAKHAGPWGLLGPKRARPPAYPLAALPRIDLILQSHNHYDHLDLGAHRWLSGRDAPQIVTPLGNREYLPEAVRERVTELDWWEGATVGNARVTVIPAQHFSARTPWDRNRALWGGHLVEIGERTLCFAGDSGHGAHYAEIGRRSPRIDVALIPIGAYDPRWFMRPVHMDPEEAVRAHQEMGARRSIAMHFGTFQLTDEGIDEPGERLVQARRQAGLPDDAFVVPKFGETILIPALP